MSQEGYDKLVAELHQLESVQLPQVKDAIAEARDNRRGCLVGFVSNRKCSPMHVSSICQDLATVLFSCSVRLR